MSRPFNVPPSYRYVANPASPPIPYLGAPTTTDLGRFGSPGVVPPLDNLVNSHLPIQLTRGPALVTPIEWALANGVEPPQLPPGHWFRIESVLSALLSLASWYNAEALHVTENAVFVGNPVLHAYREWCMRQHRITRIIWGRLLFWQQGAMGPAFEWIRLDRFARRRRQGTMSCLPSNHFVWTPFEWSKSDISEPYIPLGNGQVQENLTQTEREDLDSSFSLDRLA